LQAEFGLPVHLVDERLTSYEAEAAGAEAAAPRGACERPRRFPRAAIILQDFLNQKLPPALPPE